MAAAAYTDEELELIRSDYEKMPTRETVDMLADQLDKPFRSIVAKLVHMGIYVVPKRTSKDGREIRSKVMMAKDIGEWFGLEIPSLEKAGKLDLAKLWEVLQDPVAIRAHLVDLEFE